MNPNALLIGNGLNRAVNNTAWTDLLKKLQAKYTLDALDGCSNYPLEFERITLCAIAEGVVKENDIKKEIAKQISPPTTYKLIQSYMDLPVDTILTTNYDYNLEYNLSSAFDSKKKKSSTAETKHSLFRYYEIDDRKIWHIHGEQKYPLTICIGYMQYCSYLARMHQQLTNPTKPGQRPYLHHLLLHHESENICWPVFFFTHNIHIVGLSMSFMETDLWWLLSYRRHLMLEMPELKINNEIHYYYPDGKCEAEQIALMDSMGIQLHSQPLIRQNWARMYNEIRDSIKNYL